MNVASRIKYYRNLLRLPQVFVADHLGINRPSYTKMENGSVEFSASHLGAVANLFRVRVEDFFKPLRADYLSATPLNDIAQFRLTKDDFTIESDEARAAISQSAKDLLVWAEDKENEAALAERQKKAKATYAKFKNVNDAIQHCRTLTKDYSVGSAVDIFNMAMQEFGIWISWNSFDVFSGVYVKMDTVVAANVRLPLPLVGIHAGHPSDRQRFSGAHELGHHLLGQKGRIGSPTKPGTDPEEKDANQFAADLLMDPVQVIKVLKDVQEGYGSKLDLPSSVLLAANHLQVSYSALVRKLILIGAIPSENREALLEAKVRELQSSLSGKQRPQPFQRDLIQKCEESLNKTSFYNKTKIGAPERPEDIRFLQDYCFVEYLHSCQSKPPLDSGVVFQEVVRDIAKRYPTYLTAA